MNKFSEIQIRKAHKSDMIQIYLFEREYIIEYEKKQLDKWDLAKDRIMKMLFDNISRMFVVIVDDEISGHAYWSIYDNEPCIFSIYVCKNYRSMGIASRLMNAMENQIIESGHKKITLSTLEINPAQYLFNKMHYEEVGRKDGWIYFVKSIKSKG